MTTELTASQEIISKANKTVEFTDDSGRVFILKKTKYSDYLKLLRVLGADSENKEYVKHVIPFLSIKSINGIPAVVNNSLELDALIREIECDESALMKLASSYAEVEGVTSENEAKGDIKK